MKKRIADKTILINSLKTEVSSRYSKEAKRFQYFYNSAHPEARIWRKMLYARIFCFIRNGELVSVVVELVRFIYTASGKTFTYYGSQFLPRTKYSKELISAAVSGSKPEARFCVSRDTFFRWKALLPSPVRTQDHSPSSPAGLSRRILRCSSESRLRN